MADWWDNSRNRYERGSASSSSGLSNIGNFGWQTDIEDIKSRSSYNDSDQSVTGSSAGIFQDTQKLHGHDPTSGGGSMVDPNLHMMGLGLSSQALNWNHQALLREEKAERGFPSMLQENTNFQQDHAGMVPTQVQWREKMFPAGSSSDSSVSHELKNINRGFSLDQTQFVCPPPSNSSEHSTTCQGLPSASFQIDSSATMFHGFLGSENQPQQQQSMNFPYQVANYSMNSTSDQLLHPSLSRPSVPQFLRNSPPKQQPHHGQFHFPSNAPPYWNASAVSMNDHIRPSFFSSLHKQFSSPNLEEKPKNISGNVVDTGGAVNMMKKSGSETAASKRPRNEGPSPLPAFKVRKEKMGDRVTALQQLVSPFGKTDTASVLSEAIEYIKFLHEQVRVLSTPYLKSATPLQQQQNSVQSNEPEGQNQDLRNRGLCLVPISSTFPMTHETTVDFLTPTFGGTYR